MSAETNEIIYHCFNCGYKPGNRKTFVVKNYGGEKNNNLVFCSNRCLRQVEKADKISRPKLDPSSVHLYTIKAGIDNQNARRWNMKFKEAYRMDNMTERRRLVCLGKAILRTSKKSVKARYTHNEGALPREWH